MKQDSKIYKKMVANAIGDAKQYTDADYDGENPCVLVDKVDDGLSVIDATEAPFEHCYTLRKPSAMSLDWLKSRMVATPSAVALGVDTDAVAKWLHKNLEKFFYCTLERIIFVGGGDDATDDQDFDYLYFLDNDIASNLEEHSLPSSNMLGISWITANTAVVHVGNVIRTTKEMVDDGDLYDWEEHDVVNEGVAVSVVHELRHLAQNNPYIPEESFRQISADPETDAEQFARNFFDKHPAQIMR